MTSNFFKSTFVFATLVAMWLAPAWADTAMVWSQYEKPDSNVYFSPDGTKTIALSTQGVNVFPNLFKSRRSSWIIWKDQSDEKANQLKFAQVTHDGEILEIGTIPTVHPGIYAPAIAVDPSESRVWAVWAENNGRREVLYASFRDIGKRGAGDWRTPLQITADDEYTSNLPVIDEALLNQINIDWLRSSPNESDTASASFYASDWGPSGSISKIDESRAQATTLNPRNLHLRKMQNYDAMVKRLRKGQPLSADEQAWKNMVQNKEATSGAVHSGTGHSKRLIEAEE